MNAPLRHPTSEARLAPAPLQREGNLALPPASRDWHAVLRPFMGAWEPVLDSDGDPLMFAYPGPAASAALGHKGGSILFVRRSALRPTIEEVREAANPPRPPSALASIDLSAIDPERLSTDAWRC